MGLFHVFVEGPVSPGPEAMRRLAEAMHQRYGLATSDLVGRMSKGRFRVKGNIDEKTAEVYARDLEALGARVTIEDSDGERDRSGLINLPDMRAPDASGRQEHAKREPTPVSGTPRAKRPSAPPARPSAGKLGPVIERTKNLSDDRRDTLSPRNVTTKAPLGVNRPAAASNPPPAKEAPPAAPVDRITPVTLGAAGPSGAGIALPPAPDFDLGAPGGPGAFAVEPAIESGDFDLGAPGASMPMPAPPKTTAIHLAPPGTEPPPIKNPAPRAPMKPVMFTPPPGPPAAPPEVPLPSRVASRMSVPMPPDDDVPVRPSPAALPPPPVARPSAPPPRPAPSLPPPTAPRPSASSLPPPTPQRPAPSSLPPPPVNRMPAGVPARASTPPPTGLAAAYGAPAEQPKDLAFALAALDHNEDIAPPEVAFAAPAAAPTAFGPPAEPMLPASIGPAPVRTPVTSPPPNAKAAPARAHNPFAPPEVHEDQLAVDLAPEERRSAPPAATAAARPMPTSPVLQKKAVVQRTGMTRLSTSSDLPRWHFAAGVAVSIVLGFLPAHMIASARESSADASIDADVIEEQRKADTMQKWEALDQMRSAMEAKKKAEHRNIALLSLLIWAAAGAGVGYVWFRRIPWDRVLKT